MGRAESHFNTLNDVVPNAKLNTDINVFFSHFKNR